MAREKKEKEKIEIRMTIDGILAKRLNAIKEYPHILLATLTCSGTS
jgi:hypothetical protein